MTTDALGFVRCGEIIRVVKSWLYSVKKQKAFWELIADSVLNRVKRFEFNYNRIRDYLKKMEKTNVVIDKQKDDQDSTFKQKSLLDTSGDHEIQHTIQIRVTSSSFVPVIDRGQNDHFKFRIGIYPPSSENNDNQDNKFDYIAEEEGPPMTLAAEFALKSDMNG